MSSPVKSCKLCEIDLLTHSWLLLPPPALLSSLTLPSLSRPYFYSSSLLAVLLVTLTCVHYQRWPENWPVNYTHGTEESRHTEPGRHGREGANELVRPLSQWEPVLYKDLLTKEGCITITAIDLIVGVSFFLLVRGVRLDAIVSLEWMTSLNFRIALLHLLFSGLSGNFTHTICMLRLCMICDQFDNKSSSHCLSLFWMMI